MWSERFVAFDTETTGFGPNARVIEIGLVVFERGEETGAWSTLLDPGEGVNWGSEMVKKALVVNGIDPDELRGKPRFADVVEELDARMGADIWVAHSASFDVGMLNNERRRLGARARYASLVACTKSLAQHRRPGAPAHLQNLASRYGVAQPDAHRAEVDARVCGGVLLEMVRRGEVPADDADAVAEMVARGAPRPRAWA